MSRRDEYVNRRQYRSVRHPYRELQALKMVNLNKAREALRRQMKEGASPEELKVADDAIQFLYNEGVGLKLYGNDRTYEVSRPTIREYLVDRRPDADLKADTEFRPIFKIHNPTALFRTLQMVRNALQTGSAKKNWSVDDEGKQNENYLWRNGTLEDFQYPERFLEYMARAIADHSCEQYRGDWNALTSLTELQKRLFVQLHTPTANYEGPDEFRFAIATEDPQLKHTIPLVRFARISEKEVIIYAIQNPEHFFVNRSQKNLTKNEEWLNSSLQTDQRTLFNFFSDCRSV